MSAPAGGRAVVERRAPRQVVADDKLVAPSSPREAKTMGLRWYINGPCPRGHVAKRSVSNNECRRCVDEKRAARRLADPVWAKRRNANKYWKDPEKSREMARISRQNNLEKRRAANRRHYAENKDSYKARATAWGKAHPEYLRHQVAMRRAKLVEATPPWLTEEQRNQIRAIYARAAEFGPAFEVDHIIPLRGRGVRGLHVPWNLRIINKVANRQKGNRYG